MEPAAADGCSSTVCARVHVAGNPSDGYGGAVVSTTIPGLTARVEVVPSDAFTVRGPQRSWGSLADLTVETERVGHDGGDRLVSAALVALHRRLPPDVERAPGRFRWSTSIPRSVGLGGSSAIVLATIRAALRWWRAEGALSPTELAETALTAETGELGIAAGLADRAVQATDRPTITDCRKATPEIRVVEVARPVPLTVLVNEAAAAPSGRYHQHLRARHDAGDAGVREQMRALASLADASVEALAAGSPDALGHAIDESLRCRERLGALSEPVLEDVASIRTQGAAVNFAGSGGALVVLGSHRAPDGWRSIPVTIPAS